MPPRSVVRRGDLTQSWASVNEDADASTESFSSDMDSSPPRAELSSSKLGALKDAMNAPKGTGSSAQKPGRKPAHTTSSVRNSQIQQSQQARRRQTQTPQDESPLKMPTMSSSRVYTSPSRSPAGRASVQGNKQSRQRTSNTPQSDYSEHAQKVWSSVLAPLLQYVFSVFRIAAAFAKPVIAYGLAIWLLVGLLVMARNVVTSSLTSALAPICHIPGASMMNLPFCVGMNHTAEDRPVEFDKLISAQSAFEDILTSSASGATLPMDMKRSEASIRDLRHVVEFSTLPSRHELVFEFNGFVETARIASGDLAKYNARIGRAVDRILSTNRWTLQVLDGIAATDAAQGSVSRFVSTHLDIFAPFRSEQRVTQHVLFDQYIRHTSAIEEQIHGLIAEAQALLAVLQNLDDRLDLIASIAMRDGIRANDNKDELFAMLWTKLGGNRSSVAKLKAQLAVLRDIGAYRKMAWAHVSTTIVKLQEIAANLEDLRERVARPEVVGIRAEVPLEMHVQEILMGVERLQSVREEGRRVEGQRMASILGKERFALEGRE